MDRFPEPHFQCPRCALGDFEVEHLTRPDEPFCLVCQEADGELIRRDAGSRPSPIRPVSGLLCSPTEEAPSRWRPLPRLLRQHSTPQCSSVAQPPDQ